MVHKNNSKNPRYKWNNKNNSTKRRLSMKIKLKREKRRGIGLKCMLIAQFFKASSLKKKIRPIT